MDDLVVVEVVEGDLVGLVLEQELVDGFVREGIEGAPAPCCEVAQALDQVVAELEGPGDLLGRRLGRRGASLLSLAGSGSGDVLPVAVCD